MGGDAPLVATMLSAQTVAAALIMPIWIERNRYGDIGA
jgi:hypothetical protein